MTRFTITLEAKPDDRPPIVRVRRLLKIAWRMLGLRCTAIRAGGDEQKPAPSDPKPRGR